MNQIQLTPKGLREDWNLDNIQNPLLEKLFCDFITKHNMIEELKRQYKYISDKLKEESVDITSL